MQVKSFSKYNYSRTADRGTIKYLHRCEVQMTEDVNKMIHDAQITNEIFSDAIDECIDNDIDPTILFTTALQTILLTMFNATQNKESAISAAQFCITAADIMDEQQNSRIH